MYENCFLHDWMQVCRVSCCIGPFKCYVTQHLVGGEISWTKALRRYTVQRYNQAGIPDQISTSPSPRAVDAPHGRRTDINTYIINNITI